MDSVPTPSHTRDFFEVLDLLVEAEEKREARELFLEEEEEEEVVEEATTTEFFFLETARARTDDELDEKKLSLDFLLLREAKAALLSLAPADSDMAIPATFSHVHTSNKQKKASFDPFRGHSTTELMK